MKNTANSINDNTRQLIQVITTKVVTLHEIYSNIKETSHKAVKNALGDSKVKTVIKC